MCWGTTRTSRADISHSFLVDIANKLFLCSGVIVEKICEYLCYNEKHKDQVNVPDMDIPPELCLELLMAADFLNT